MKEFAELGAELVELVGSFKAYVNRQHEAVIARLATLEQRQPEKGDRGERGIDGEPGRPGDRGEEGKEGPVGETGAHGKDGAPGERGEKGLDGAPGERGPQGEAGAPGRDGLDGQRGAPGRDAVHIEILPAIDEKKSYPRSTYATHRGGLWRSYETTDGMKGWECIVDGDAEDEIIQGEDLRSFTFRRVKSSGRVVERSFELPVVLYREIWTEREYATGDSVTRDGCQWIAVAPASPDDVPGKSEVWKMSVRKGRDGTHGLRGEKGDRGAAGKDWAR